MRTRQPFNQFPSRRGPSRRRGVVIVLAALFSVVLMGFVAFSLDTGLISVTQNDLQVAVDAAALAASHEITAAVEEAANSQDTNVDVNTLVAQKAANMAVQVAAANGVYVSPDNVEFGRRYMNPTTGDWEYQWGLSPYNVIKVTAYRNQPDVSAPDGRLQLAFGWALGMPSVALQASSVAFVDARDIAVVLDYSASMNDDSEISAADRLPLAEVEQNLRDIFNALGNIDVGTLPVDPAYLTVTGTPASGTKPQCTVRFQGKSIYVTSTKALTNVVMEFDNGSHQKIDNLSAKTGTFKGSGSNNNRYILKAWVKSGSNSSTDGVNYGERFENSVTNVRKAFGLTNKPFPYSTGSWDSFINYCRDDDSVEEHGYRYKYGGMLLASYLLRNQPGYSQTRDLWKTPHYPFHAMKNGTTLFCEFLDSLAFGDHIGLVTYDETARVENKIDDAYMGVQADLHGQLISDDYDTINTLQRHKQAGHYAQYTAMGDGVKVARELLQSHGRSGARPTILLMTDGQANRSPSNFKLPNNWSWTALTDYDGDGSPNYTTSDKHKQYAFYQAKQAIDAGMTVHTLTVGAGADRDLMKAIAFAGSGIWVDVPGGSTISEMEDQMLDAFAKIAAAVPPAKLVYNGSDGP